MGWVTWDNVIASYGAGGLNIGSLKSKSLALLGKWWWKYRKGCEEKLWCKVIRSVHGIDGALGRGACISSRGGGVGGDIWLGEVRLKDRFPRLYELEREKNVLVSKRGEDTWKWNLSEDGDFTVKELTAIIQDQSTNERQSNHETIWNRLVPRKINVFVWRATKGRLPGRVGYFNGGRVIQCHHMLIHISYGSITLLMIKNTKDDKTLEYFGKMQEKHNEECGADMGYKTAESMKWQRKVKDLRVVREVDARWHLKLQRQV
nr:reverse transcriptase domain, reverse transcriptase zinc-binding domain protein [Tanacetum cinerariifolium]